MAFGLNVMLFKIFSYGHLMRLQTILSSNIYKLCFWDMMDKPIKLYPLLLRCDLKFQVS